MGEIIMSELVSNNTVPVRHFQTLYPLGMPVNLQTYAQIAGKGCNRRLICVGGSINKEEEGKTGFVLIQRNIIVR